MKDLFDLAGLVFAELIKSHGEQELSRELFFYSVVNEVPFYLLDPKKVITISGAGVSKNFDDDAIDLLHKQWNDQVQAHKQKIAAKIANDIKKPNQQPKDGDVFNFWQGDSDWKEIKL